MRVYLKPAPGRRVRIPETNRHLPDAGEFVEDSAYWRRRVQVGDAFTAIPPYMGQAYGTIDAVVAMLEAALAEAAANGSTPEAAAAALEAFELEAVELFDKGRQLADQMEPAEAAQVDTYAASKIGPARAKLEAMAAGHPTPPAEPAKATAKARKAKA